MCGHTRDPVIYSKFYRNPFKGFGAPGGQNLALPITLASRFYNSLYCRTSRDNTVAQLVKKWRHGWQKIPEDVRLVSDDPLKKCSAKSSSRRSASDGMLCQSINFIDERVKTTTEMCGVLCHTVCYHTKDDLGPDLHKIL